MRIIAPALVLFSSLAACSGDPGASGSDGAGAGTGSSQGGGGAGGMECPPDVAPSAPTITAPEPNRIDIVSDALILSSSAFADPDAADQHGGSEFEIWKLKDGALSERIWRAAIIDKAHLTTLELAHGSFEGSAAKKGLEPWDDYAVRARYRDDRGACSQFSEWSAPLSFRTDDGSTYLFDPTVIREIRVEIPQASWDGINAQAHPPGCVPWHRDHFTATLKFEGETFEGVGIHVKGGCGSARDLNGKPGLKISLDWDDPSVPGCPVERRLHGQKSLALNNGVQDRSFLHERLGYMLYQEMGVPTPRAAHVRLFVNDKDYGLYLNVETISRRFLSRRFASNKGILYEGTYFCDIVPQNVPQGTDDSGCLTREFKPSACSPQDPSYDPQDYEPVRELAQQIQDLPQGGFYPEVEQFFNYDTFLSQWAVESVINHWDAYEFSIINNYRFYHDPSTDKWTIIPTGIDQTFQTGQNVDPWGVQGILASRCTSEPDCNAAFAARLKQVNALFQSFDYPAKAATIKQLISPQVMTDPRKEYSFGEFDSACQDTNNFIASRPAIVTQHLANHGF